MVFNEDHFPFHDGFLDKRNPLKTLTENTFALSPPCSAVITASNINNPTSLEGDTQADNYSSEGQSAQQTSDSENYVQSTIGIESSTEGSTSRSYGNPTETIERSRITEIEDVKTAKKRPHQHSLDAH